MLLTIIGTCLLVLILWIVLVPRSEPWYNMMCSQPGAWIFFKKCFIYLMLKLRGYHNKNTNGPGDAFVLPFMEHPFECPQQLTGKHALDAVYINGMNKDGVCLVMRIGRRHNREAELWLSIKVPGMGFYQSPVHPDTKVCNTDGKGFNVGGLRFECLEPHKKWKINFNGVLREGLCNTWLSRDKGKLVHVRLSFLWETFSDVFDFGADLHPWLLADAFALEKGRNGIWNQFESERRRSYEQWGELRGLLAVEGKKERNLFLRSCRNHTFESGDWRSRHRNITHLGWMEDGTSFHVGVESSPLISNLKRGYVNRPNSIQHAVTSVDLDVPNLREAGCPRNSYKLNFSAGGKHYHVECKCHTTPVYYHGRDWGTIVYEQMCDFTVNGKKGWGITELCFKRPGGDCPVPHQKSAPMLNEPESCSKDDESALVLILNQPPCCSSRLVGGKGSHLAMLTQMKTTVDVPVIIPPGFCLTLTAFATHLRANKALDKQLTDLAGIACGKTKGCLNDACDKTVGLFLQTQLCVEIEESIKSHLNMLFPDDWQQLKFAVRSSAAGEDSEELSAAGQMETSLGVEGLHRICDAVKSCWSSHFSFTAVEYRRQHGQAIYSSIGIVIQKMVEAEAAGVLFTRHPLTGNPQYMTINANYGLGESVVSGSAEPDSITMERDFNDNLKIVSKVIGSKETEVTMADGSGTVESEVSAERADKCCISDGTIIRLGHLGMELERSFTDSRDIEWAVTEDQIYVLQARPITTFDQETEWEVMHEFDTPLTTDKVMLTRDNIGEVVPGYATPLGLTMPLLVLDEASQAAFVRAGLHSRVGPYNKYFACCVNQVFLNLSFMQGGNEKSIVGVEKRGTEMAICGEPIKDFPLDDLIEYNMAFPLYRRIWNAFKYGMQVFGAYKATKRWTDRLLTYNLSWENCTPKEVYETLNYRIRDYFECHINHILNSASSVSWNTILLRIVTGGALRLETEHYADMALLLSTCGDVKSADVPAAIEKVAKAVRTSSEAGAFINMGLEEALQWLQSAESGQAGQYFADFMSKHGHRCINESEIHEKSWKDDPSKIIKTLQRIASDEYTNNPRELHLLLECRALNHTIVRIPDWHGSSTVGVQDTNETIGKLQSPISTFGRQVLKLVLPKARKAVGTRELGKSTVIHVLDHLKQGYWRLAHLMVEEGRIPDADLLFYFTWAEVGQLLKTRSGRLIGRAQRRRRLRTKLEELEFPMLQRGHPVPVPVQEEEEPTTTTLTASGAPVSQGTAKGVARIVKSLDNAGTIQAGDILVVKTTDVGWSPYFPLISGLVTEIGGIVSHGAVVAREYGIPCVVNVKRATSLFKSGDKVLLNGTTGTFEKLTE